MAATFVDEKVQAQFRPATAMTDAKIMIGRQLWHWGLERRKRRADRLTGPLLGAAQLVAASAVVVSMEHSDAGAIVTISADHHHAPCGIVASLVAIAGAGEHLDGVWEHDDGTWLSATFLI